MKVVVTTLNFSKDPAFNTSVCDPIAYIVQYKRHWWNRLKYIMDDDTHCPKLFFTKEQALLNARIELMK